MQLRVALVWCNQTNMGYAVRGNSSGANCLLVKMAKLPSLQVQANERTCQLRRLGKLPPVIEEEVEKVLARPPNRAIARDMVPALIWRAGGKPTVYRIAQTPVQFRQIIGGS